MICRNHVDVSEGVRRCARCEGPFCRDCYVEFGGRPYCAICKNEQLLDLRSGVDSTQLELASIGRRFAAVLLDSLVVLIPMYTVMGLLIFLPNSRGEVAPMWTNFLGLPFMFLGMLYEALMLQFKDGQTLGKRALHVRVVRPDGSSISTGQVWGRVLIRTVLGCFWIDYITVFFTPERTTLHDMVANTRVVRTS
jgi:uncharacterized RDD family membrane protein YckC